MDTLPGCAPHLAAAAAPQGMSGGGGSVAAGVTAATAEWGVL